MDTSIIHRSETNRLFHGLERLLREGVIQEQFSQKKVASCCFKGRTIYIVPYLPKTTPAKDIPSQYRLFGDTLVAQAIYRKLEAWDVKEALILEDDPTQKALDALGAAVDRLLASPQILEEFNAGSFIRCNFKNKPVFIFPENQKPSGRDKYSPLLNRKLKNSIEGILATKGLKGVHILEENPFKGFKVYADNTPPPKLRFTKQA